MTVLLAYWVYLIQHEIRC